MHIRQTGDIFNFWVFFSQIPWLEKWNYFKVFPVYFVQSGWELTMVH